MALTLPSQLMSDMALLAHGSAGGGGGGAGVGAGGGVGEGEGVVDEDGAVMVKTFELVDAPELQVARTAKLYCRSVGREKAVCEVAVDPVA